MIPVLFRVGPLTVYSFGLMMALGFLVAGHLATRELGRKGMPAELGSSLLIWAAVGGLVGSRVWALAEDWGQVWRDPLGSLLSGAGFVWYGGFVGGALAVTWVVKRNNLSWLRVTDSIAPGMALGHGIGRIGCQLAGDGDWGTVTDVPWGMAYPNAIIGWPYPPGVYVHPTPIYECLAYTAVFAVLWHLRTRPRGDGWIFSLYLVLAPACRFLVEFVRHNEVRALGLTDAQLFSLLLVAVGALGLFLTAQPPAEESARATVARRESSGRRK